MKLLTFTPVHEWPLRRPTTEDRRIMRAWFARRGLPLPRKNGKQNRMMADIVCRRMETDA